MVDQRQTNTIQANTSMQGEETTKDHMTINVVQREMLKALKETREGKGMMMTMMIKMQKQQKKMVNFYQQLMQVPTFKVVFPGSMQAARAGADNNDKNNQNAPLITKS